VYKRQGLTLRDELVFWYTTENRAEIISAAMAKFSPCDGVVCYNDEAALQIAKAIHAQQLKPLQIASFDHSTYASLSPEPVYSLVSPMADIGSAAGRKMLAILRGEPCASEVLPWRNPA
jgi:DNA-binding LacI/PurR family transcriptional regulator